MMESQKLVNIGDRIVGKRTGIMMPSTVVCIMEPTLFMSSAPVFQIGAQHLETWDENYEGWDKKPVVITKFDTPQKEYTKQQIIEDLEAHPTIFTKSLLDANIPKEALDIVYQTYWETSPARHYGVYPFEDVDVLYSAEEYSSSENFEKNE